MANLDFTPLYRSAVGFDRMPQLMKSAMQLSETEPGFPPYNIEKIDENSYRIVMAVAGFVETELNIVTQGNQLTVIGKKPDQQKPEFLYRGFTERSFERKFELADHIEVVDADLQNGLLTIELEHRLPERLKPRTVDISTGAKKASSGKKTA
ncbi:MAG: Hsp20 family protein [Rhizobiales bacterium]|nr:Hsp20 family protein [Hyphomicrobiales bacterium]